MKVFVTTGLFKDQSLQKMMLDLVKQVNGLSEFRMSAKHTAMTAAPTQGEYAVGDFVPNSAPAELGLLGSKYVIEGWVCIVSGNPGTFVQKRFLTGN